MLPCLNLTKYSIIFKGLNSALLVVLTDFSLLYVCSSALCDFPYRKQALICMLLLKHDLGVSCVLIKTAEIPECLSSSRSFQYYAHFKQL